MPTETEQPDPALIARDNTLIGKPEPRPFPLGAGRNDPTVNREALPTDEWSRSMTDDEVDAFIDGR